MPNRSRHSADDRADARRRARRAARGADTDPELAETDDEETPGPSSGRESLLTRLFPPAPPLPGRPDPMRGFGYRGPLPGVVGGVYLLARSPLPWILGGALWATGQLFRSDSFIGFFSLFASFAGLIGAGWFGWQRPWLFGLAAGVVGWLVLLGAYVGLSAALPTANVTSSPTPTALVASPSATSTASAEPSPTQSAQAGSSHSAEPTPSPSGGTAEANAGGIAAALVTELIFQAGLGAFAGWYGGYLRRRSAATSSSAASQRARRRR